ncbi:DUF7257 domain-containing protein [Rhodococcus opacus]|uniref:DUF7257 domain-containing protein n=1 Tax=Rhodococcus opacus TaxID=37919 RepID=UPI0006BB5382|nr:hypothetical protein [Rhodococcus opacus]
MEHLPRRVPAGDLELLDYLVPILQDFVGDVPIIGDLLEILSGVEDGTLDDVGSWVNNLIANLTGLGKNTNRILMELQAKLAEGAKFTDTFDRANNSSSLGNGWVQGGGGAHLGILDNAARIDNSGGILAPTGRRYAICPQTADSDSMTVAAGVNNAGVAVGAMTTLFIRANAALTEFVFANVYGKSVYMGRGTRTGTTWTFTDWTSKPTGVTIPEGALIELQANGNNYVLTCNGQTLLSHLDSSGYPVDASHRTVGFSSETRQVGLFKQFSWGLVAFTLRSAVQLTALSTASTNASAALGTANSANNTAIDANTNAGTALEAAISAASTLAEFTAREEGGQNSGTVITETFPTSPFGAQWGVSDATQIGIQNAMANILNSSTTPGNYGLRHTTAMVTDDHMAKIVIGQTGTNTAPTRILIRCASGGSSFVHCSVYANKIEIGRGSGAYGTYATPWATLNSVTPKAGNTVEFRAVGNQYFVMLNGIQVLTYTDSGNTATVGASNRFVGLVFNRTDISIIWYRGCGVSSFSGADVKPTAMIGKGFGLYRASTSPITLTGSTTMHVLADAVFDNRRFTEQGCTVYTVGDGTVIINTEGWWAFAMNFEINNDNTDEALVKQAIPSLYWSPTFSDPRVPIRYGGGATDNPAIGATFLVYLREGEVVQPGISAERDTVIGNATGSLTYFEGTLVSAPRGPQGLPGVQGVPGPPGIQGPTGTGIQIDGTVATYAALPAGTPDGSQYVVTADNLLYVKQGGAWPANGAGLVYRGPTGATGAPGTNGTNVTLQRVTSLPGSGTAGVIYWIPV